MVDCFVLQSFSDDDFMSKEHTKEVEVEAEVALTGAVASTSCVQQQMELSLIHI